MWRGYDARKSSRKVLAGVAWWAAIWAPAALGQVGAGYKAMARAARSGNHTGYTKAQSAIRSELASFAAAYKGLQALGYKTGA